MIILLLITGLLLDGFLANIISNSSYFIPLITITNIFLIYNFYKKHIKSYFVILIVLGLFYDLLYTNLLFFHMIIFITIGLISKLIYKYFKITNLKLLICVPIIIMSYELLTASLLFIFQIIPLDISKLTYKIIHSLLLNIIYAETIFFSFERIKEA